MARQGIIPNYCSKDKENVRDLKAWAIDLGELSHLVLKSQTVLVSPWQKTGGQLADGQ